MELFTNQQIDIASLPRMRDVEYTKPQKSYLGLTLIKSIVFWLIMTSIFITATIAARQELPHLIPYAKVLFFSFAITSIILTWISYYKRGHALRENDIIYKEGVLFNNVTTISFNRVQHCEISQGPFEQMFDLYTLKVFTAGGQSSDLEIPGLDKETADGLKEYIVEETAKNTIENAQETNVVHDFKTESSFFNDSLTRLNTPSEEE